MTKPRIIETVHSHGKIPREGDTTIAWQGVIKRRIQCVRVSEHEGRTFAHWVVTA